MSKGNIVAVVCLSINAILFILILFKTMEISLRKHIFEGGWSSIMKTVKKIARRKEMETIIFSGMDKDSVCTEEEAQIRKITNDCFDRYFHHVSTSVSDVANTCFTISDMRDETLRGVIRKKVRKVINLGEFEHGSHFDSPYSLYRDFRNWKSIEEKEDGKLILFVMNDIVYSLYDESKHAFISCDLPHNSIGFKIFNKLLIKLKAISPTYAEKCGEGKEERKKKTGNIEIQGEFVFGSDPEFEVVKGSSYIGAFTALSKVDSFKGKRAGEYCSSSKGVGTDGCSETLELRPVPAKDYEGCVKSVRDRLVSLCEDYYIFNVSDKGNKHALGGHLHVGGKLKKPTGGTIPVYPDSSLVRLYDYFIGQRFKTLNGRARGGYGGLGSIERKSYGFEYRSLPSCVFNNPEITRIVYKMFGEITKRFFSYQTFIIGGKVATKKEYKRFVGLTDKEYTTMVRFIRAYKLKRSSNIIHNWFSKAEIDEMEKKAMDEVEKIHLSKPEKPLPTKHLYFSKNDTFNSNLKKYLTSALDGYEILFKGLHERRGNDVFAFSSDIEIEGMKNISKEFSPEFFKKELKKTGSAVPVVALPANIRNKEFSIRDADLLKVVDKIIDGIKKSIPSSVKLDTPEERIEKFRREKDKYEKEYFCK